MIGIALVLFVQARDVFPQFLLVRLLFSIGAAGISTMITAILPTMTANRGDEGPESFPPFQDPLNDSPSISSEVTITPHRQPTKKAFLLPSPSRSAGLVGLFSGCGALFALLIFLRLPDLIEGGGAGMCPFVSEATSSAAYRGSSAYFSRALTCVLYLFYKFKACRLILE